MTVQIVTLIVVGVIVLTVALALMAEAFPGGGGEQ